MEKNMDMNWKWKLDEYSGFWGVGFPKMRGASLGVPMLRFIV